MLLAPLLVALQTAAPRPVESLPPQDDVTPDAFGSSVALCGDLDGDGRSEFAVGGCAYKECAASILIYSGATGAILRRIEPLLETSTMGGSLCRTKDMDGDGVDDMALRCHWDDWRGGRVELRSGRTGVLVRVIAAGAGEFQFGTGISDIGDIDGDGTDDLVVSADLVKRNEGWSGMRWIVFSGASGERRQVLEWRGPRHRGWNSSQSNPAATALGDVDGDGVSDFAVVDGGKVRVQSGARSKTIYEFEIPEQEAGYGFRYAVCPRVDLDCDGRSEIIVGTPFVNGESSREPQVYVRAYSGATGQPMSFIARWGEEAGFGFGLRPASDANQDGIPDLWVTQCTDFTPGLSLVSGRDGSELRSIPCTDRPWAIDGGADVDGDGTDDVIVSEYTPFVNNSRSDGAFVFSGKDARLLHKKLVVWPSAEPKK